MMKLNLKWNDFYSKMVEALIGLKNSEEFLDVTLCLSDGLLRAHKAILSISSPFLCDMLKEVPYDTNQIVYLQDVSVSDLKDVLTFIYSGEVSVHHQDIPRFVEIAKALQIRGILEGDQQRLESFLAARTFRGKTRKRSCPDAAESDFAPVEDILTTAGVEDDSFVDVDDRELRYWTRRIKTENPNSEASISEKRKKDVQGDGRRRPTKKTRVQCSECDIEIDKRSFVRHMRVKHHIGKPPAKPERPKPKDILDRPKPKQRKKTVINGAFVECMHCGIKISRKSFKRHLTSKHEYVNTAEVFCPICRKRYKHMEYMEEHCRTRHDLYGEEFVKKLKELELETGSAEDMSGLPEESFLRSNSEYGDTEPEVGSDELSYVVKREVSVGDDSTEKEADSIDSLLNTSTEPSFAMVDVKTELDRCIDSLGS